MIKLHGCSDSPLLSCTSEIDCLQFVWLMDAALVDLLCGEFGTNISPVIKLQENISAFKFVEAVTPNTEHIMYKSHCIILKYTYIVKVLEK